MIISMGTPGPVYRWWFGSHALKMLKRNILRDIGVSPVRSTVYGNVEGRASRRHRWLKQVEELVEARRKVSLEFTLMQQFRRDSVCVAFGDVWTFKS